MRKIDKLIVAFVCSVGVLWGIGAVPAQAANDGDEEPAAKRQKTSHVSSVPKGNMLKKPKQSVPHKVISMTPAQAAFCMSVAGMLSASIAHDMGLVVLPTASKAKRRSKVSPGLRLSHLYR